MLRTLKNKAFSIIELLVVIVIIIIIVVIAYPQISNYLIDREVKSEVNRFVKYFKERQGEVQSGKYGIYVLNPGFNSQHKADNHYLTPEEFNIQNKAGRFSKRYCPGSPESIHWGDWKVADNPFRWSSDVNMWMNKSYCISRDAMMHPGSLEHTVPAGKMSFIVCSTANTANHNNSNSSTICNFNNKKGNRYAVGIYRDLSIKIFKYNLGSDKWILQK